MLWIFLWLAVALAEQHSYAVKKGQMRWYFEVTWQDNGQPHQTHYSLPTSAIEVDLQIPTRYTAGQLAKQVAKEVNAWARTVNSPFASVKARGSGNGRLQLRAKGSDQTAVNQLLQRARAEEQRVEQALLVERGYRKYSNGIAPDYSLLVHRYSSLVRPLQTALERPTTRQQTEVLLGFVQSIPYEARRKIEFRRPLALLAANAGDCDSKAVLFLALLRAANPNLPLAIVDIPDHIFVGVGISPKAGEQALEVGGTTFVLMEPVGPALIPIGEVSPRSLQALQGGQARVIELD